MLGTQINLEKTELETKNVIFLHNKFFLIIVIQYFALWVGETSLQTLVLLTPVELYPI